MTLTDLWTRRAGLSASAELLVAFINSVTKVFNQDVTCILFADDVKRHTVIRSSYDFVNLQSALDKTALSSKEHQLPISVKNCSFIQLAVV